MAIRAYRPHDRAAVYDICARTADAGADARHMVSDPLLPGHVYAGPYLELCPELAFVLTQRTSSAGTGDEGEAVAGYVIAALDTRAFVAAYRERWLPLMQATHPPPAGPHTTFDEQLLAALHQPEALLTPELRTHPSHLHVNLLPSAQGKRHGRALLDTVCSALRAAGSPAVHLGVRRRNERAAGFYPRAGFALLRAEPDALFFGRSLG